MDNIKNVGHNIWLVNGRVIGSKHDGTFDDSTLGGRAVLVDVADNVCSGPLFAHAGDPLYAFFFQPARKESGCRFLLSGRPHLRELPDDARMNLKKEMPEHADEF